jgi:hypothetical protein
MSFEPRGIFKSTKVKEYDSYCQGVQDIMDILEEEAIIGRHNSHEVREKVLNLVVEAADGITN